MEILGVPIEKLFLSLLVSLIITISIFWPAIDNFGKTLIGKDDVKFFIWLFSHNENSISQGTNPLFAKEIFYPDGIWITRNTIVPLLSAIDLLLPQSWGVFGRITVIQMLSFVLGGVFSFALCYRLTKSFFPSLLGSFVYNFSTIHLQSSINHLNYAMSIPFIALFFIFYLDLREGKRSIKTIVGLACALLLVALNEETVALMIGLLVFVDLSLLYMRHNHKEIKKKEVIILFLTGLFVMLVSTVLGIISQNLFVNYFLPPAIFMASVIFIVIGTNESLKAEHDLHMVEPLAYACIPTIVYLIIIAILPAYDYTRDIPIVYSIVATVPAQYLFLPSELSSISHFFPWSLKIANESGVYLGIGVIFFIAVSFLLKGASEVEIRLRDLMFVSLLFSFPIIVIGDQLIFGSPFLPQTLFPLLSVLRVPARFILFVVLFASLCVSLVSKRMIETKEKKLFFYLAFALSAIIVVEMWPDYNNFLFSQPVPQFYMGLIASGSHPNIFLYPNADYYDLLNEAYYQSLYRGNLSEGVLSRQPVPADSSQMIESGEGSPEQINGFVKSHGFDYIVVQKELCATSRNCFMDLFLPMDSQNLSKIENDLGGTFGNPIFQDNSIIVYNVTKP